MKYVKSNNQDNDFVLISSLWNHLLLKFRLGTDLGDNLLMCEMKWEIVYIATTADVHTFCFMKGFH